jgi:hypothetical protein
MARPGWTPGRIGALGGALVSGIVVVLGLVASGPWVLEDAVVGLAVILIVTVVPGWVVGSRVGPSLRSSVLGVLGYAALAWLLWVPISVVGSTWQGIRDGSFANPVEVVLMIVFQLAYAALLSIFLWMLGIAPALAWMITFRVLGRLVLL